MDSKLDIEAILGEPRPNFEPVPFYNHAGDCVQYYFDDSPSVSERIDCWLTVYKSEDGRLIGFKLDNIRDIIAAIARD